MSIRKPSYRSAIVTGLALVASLVSGCGEKEPAPASTPATARTAPPPLHDFEADRKAGSAPAEKPPAGRRMPALHDFEADRKKAQK